MSEVTDKNSYNAIWLTSEVQTIPGPVWPNTEALGWFSEPTDPTCIYIGSFHDHGGTWDSSDFDVYLEDIDRLVLVWGDATGHYWDWPVGTAYEYSFGEGVDDRTYQKQRNMVHVAAMKMLAQRLRWTLGSMNDIIARTLEAYRA